MTKKERVLITGASGFIGSNVTRQLFHKGLDIHALSHSTFTQWRLKDLSNKIKVHKCNLEDYQKLIRLLRKINPNYIVHLAAYGAYPHQADLMQNIKTNVLGTTNLLEASKQTPYKCFVNAGSSSEYGRKNVAMKENDFCNPISYYAATKLASTNICKIFALNHNKPIVTLRLFSVYGPYEEPTRFIPTIINSLIKRDVIKLTPGNQRRDFIYVDDVSTAIIKALKLGKKIQGEVINVGTGKEYTNDEIVKILFRVSNEKTLIKKGAYPKRLWDMPHWKADTTKANILLGKYSKHNLENGILKTYSWLKNNSQFYTHA